jgi:hypothetical protein
VDHDQARTLLPERFARELDPAYDLELGEHFAKWTLESNGEPSSNKIVRRIV